MGCRRWWILVPRSHVEIATQSLDTAKDTSQKSEPMQRSWCSQPSRTPWIPWSWLDAVQSSECEHRDQSWSVELGNRRYLIIQVPALYVDNQNPQIGLKASKAQTCKVQRDICQNIDRLDFWLWISVARVVAMIPDDSFDSNLGFQRARPSGNPQGKFSRICPDLSFWRQGFFARVFSFCAFWSNALHNFVQVCHIRIHTVCFYNSLCLSMFCVRELRRPGHFLEWSSASWSSVCARNSSAKSTRPLQG